jgi:hypothetical protein
VCAIPFSEKPFRPRPPMEREQIDAAMDAHFKAVGEATTAYHMMEMGFSWLFRALLDAPDEQVQAIWSERRNLENRINIAKAISRVSVNGDLLDRTQTALRQLNDMTKKRAQIAHGATFVHAEVIENEIANHSVRFTEGWTLEGIIEQAKEFRALHFKLGQLGQDILDSKAQSTRLPD